MIQHADGYFIKGVWHDNEPVKDWLRPNVILYDQPIAPLNKQLLAEFVCILLLNIAIIGACIALIVVVAMAILLL